MNCPKRIPFTFFFNSNKELDEWLEDLKKSISESLNLKDDFSVKMETRTSINEVLSPKKGVSTSVATSFIASPNPYKIVLLGGQCGKSSFAYRFVGNKFDNDDTPTPVEYTFHHKFLIHFQEVKVEILDTSGDGAYSHMRKQWIEWADGFMIIYNQSIPSSFQEANLVYHAICKTHKIKFPKILIATASDLTQKVDPDTGRALAEKM